MDTQQIKDFIMQELPGILREDAEVQDLVLKLSAERFADRDETHDRFDQVLEELRRDREEQSRKWEGQDRKWWEQNRKWEENQEEIRELMRSVGRLDSTAGALGARWGLHA